LPTRRLSDLTGEEIGLDSKVVRSAEMAWVSPVSMRVLRVARWCLVLSSSLLHAQVPDEYQVKAAFLLNLAQFVAWPAEAFTGPEMPFVIGVLGRDPFKQVLDERVRNESVGNRRVVVRRLDRIQDLRVCHILFVATSEADCLPDILSRLTGQPILTVSELDGFVQSGGMVRLYTDHGKVRLRINNEAARSSHLVVSSKVLRLAEVVTPNPSDGP
jgi:hypothetical protein